MYTVCAAFLKVTAFRDLKWPFHRASNLETSRIEKLSTMKQHWHWTSSCRQWQLLLSSCPTTHKSWYGLLKTHVRGETDHLQKKSGRLRIIEFFRFDFAGSWSPSWLGGRLVSHPSCPKMVMHESMSDWRMILPTGIVHVDRLV